MKWVKQCPRFLNLSTIIMLLLLSHLLNPAAFARGSSAADFLFEMGKKHYERGDYQEALRELEKVLLAEPEHARALIYIEIIEDELALLELEEEIGDDWFYGEETIYEEAVTEPLLKAEAGIVFEEEEDILPDILPLELELNEEEPTEELIIPKIRKKRVPAEYVLGIGDVINVTMWRNNELGGSVTIRPDGRISLPLLGEIKASGLTPRQLNKTIAQGHRKYIRDPEVTVIVTGFASKRILVLGEVGRPGIYKIPTPTTALEAIVNAGGHRKNSAVLKSVVIVRGPYSDTPEIIFADLWSAVYRNRFDKDIALQSGDIVYVPKSFFGKVSDFLSLLNSYVRPTAETYFGHDLDFVKD